MFRDLTSTDDRTAEYRVVADLYHGFFTGIFLTLVTRRGVQDAAEFTYRMFRRKHYEQFLPGLEKLGISHLPAPVTSAQFHYLANRIGEVKVEYMYESDRKAWIRYPPPRYAWYDAAITGIPGAVSRVPRDYREARLMGICLATALLVGLIFFRSTTPDAFLQLDGAAA